MSAKLMGQVWERDVSSTEQAVLLALADHADDEGGSCYPSVERVAWKVGAGRSTVKRTLKKLRDAGALRVVREAARHRPTEYRIDLDKLPAKPPFGGRAEPPPGMRAEVIEKFAQTCRWCERRGAEKDPDGKPWQVRRISPKVGYEWSNVALCCEACGRRGSKVNPLIRGVKTDDLGGSNNGSRGATSLTPEPSVEPSVEPPTVGSEGREPLSVDKKTVTSAEHDLCDGILAAFNESAGTDFRATRYRTGIIGRIRERPDLELADHRRVIEAALADPWWDDSPSPAVIYGKDTVFERALNLKPRKAYSHERGGDRSEYDVGRTD